MRKMPSACDFHAELRSRIVRMIASRLYLFMFMAGLADALAIKDMPVSQAIARRTAGFST